MLETCPELVLEILDLLAIPIGFPADNLPDQAALLSCSLVCKRWSTPSQRLLFRRVVIDELWAGGMFVFRPQAIGKRPSHRITSFLETITTDTEKSRWLRRNVLSIVLRPHASARASDTLAILVNLPNLRELNIIGVACIFSDQRLSQLRSLGPSIRSLRVDSDHAGPVTSIGHPTWPAVIRLIRAIPTIRVLDITANSFQEFPRMPELIPPLGLGLLSFKFSSKWVANMSSFVASLVGSRTDNETTIQIFSQTLSKIPADLHEILSFHAPHLRSLVVQGQLKDFKVLDLCTHLERFECKTIPSDELVAAIPRTIKALAVTNPIPDPARILNPHLQSARLGFRPLPTARPSYLSAVHLTEQLGSFPNLRLFNWMGSTAHPGFSALRERCTNLGIELRSEATNSSKVDLSYDEIQFSLRSRLLQL
ncbi:hypothetical protein B0H14DRAFT_3871409 [Mycena olivaceomarginata]|nr:hypothetical protein B0H14DRAFT_3871409 [Mycena olivaceomarginata]